MALKILNTLDRKSIVISTYDANFINSANKNMGIKIPWDDKIDTNTITEFAKFSIDTAFNNSGALLIEDFRSDKWKVSAQNATSFIISVKHPDSSYSRNENILFTNPEMNKLFSLSVTPPVSDFDTLETKALVKKIIDTIKFSK